MRQFSPSKRRLLQAAGATLLIQGCEGSRTPKDLELLPSVVDTILPADEHEGALGLGIHEKLEALSQEDEEVQKWVNYLTTAATNSALNQFNKPFEKLALEQREKILIGFFDRETDSNTRRAIYHVRRQVIYWYYGSVDGHKSINYQHPGAYQLSANRPKIST